MRILDIIAKKRDGIELPDEEIRELIRQYTSGEVPDYQMSAFAMATYLRGMTERETVTLTDAMMRSGDIIDLSRFGDKSVDKHSTGGVGDKTTLILGPIVSCLGGKLAKMSGRGLGHTGGTVDKLEAIPGYRTTLSAEEFMEQVEKIGVAVIGQSGNLTPADKKLYALRDVTGTVGSLPLITSSVMAKKLAAGSHSIVLDVKIGSGAFMKTLADGRRLAENMVKIGKVCGRKMAAVMTNMDIPLGNSVGNALEVMEAVEVLRGRGSSDLREVCLILATQMLMLCNKWDERTARARAEASIASGAAFEQMKKWISAQGGDSRALEDFSLLPQASIRHQVLAPQSGWIKRMDTERVGEASGILGAGRQTKDDVIDPAAGIVLKKKTGAYVEAGEPIATLYTNKEETVPAAELMLLNAITFCVEQPEAQAAVFDIIR